MTEIIIFTAVMIYGLYKWTKTKSESLLLGIIMAVSLFLAKKLDLPSQLALSLWSFIGFAVLLRKFLQKRSEPFLWIFSIMFLGFGIIFLIQAIVEMGYGNSLLKFVHNMIKNDA